MIKKWNYQDFENKVWNEVFILNCINPRETNNKKIIFNVMCNCGSLREVNFYHIIHRIKLTCKKCGWKRVGIKRKKKDAGFNAVYLHYQKSAEKRGLTFQLNKDEVRNLTSLNCHYCNRKPHMYIFKDGRNRTQYIYNGIDRIDSSKGYFTENCLPCCKFCNIAKNNMSIEEFMQLIKDCYENLFLKKEAHG